MASAKKSAVVKRAATAKKEPAPAPVSDVPGFGKRKPDAKPRKITTGGMRGKVIAEVTKSKKKAVTVEEVAKALSLTEKQSKTHLTRAALDGLISKVEGGFAAKK